MRKYELAVDKLRTKNDPIFLNAITNPITFTDCKAHQYSSSAPDPTVTAGTAIGLSEYANANFVSEGELC